MTILIYAVGINSLTEHPTYNLTYFSASRMLNNHKSILIIIIMILK